MTNVQFIHIVVKIRTTKKRNHELISEVTCLVRDSTMVKINPDEGDSQDSSEENTNHSSGTESLSQSVIKTKTKQK